MARKISEEPLATTLTADDVLLGNDGTVTKRFPATLLPGLVSDVHVAGLVENDQGAAAANTALIQAALNAAVAATASRNAYTGAGVVTGAKVVVLPPGRFYLDRNADGNWYCLLLDNATILRGSGWGTRLVLKDGVVTVNSDAGACSMVYVKNNASFAGVEDLAIDGNKAGQTATWLISHGVDMRRNDSAELYDGGLWCNHVLAFGCLGNGFDVSGAANTATLLNCYSYHNANNGFMLKTDQRVIGCKAGNNTWYGYQVTNSTSCLISGCKGFGNYTDLIATYSENLIVDNFTSEDFKGEAGIQLIAVRSSRVTGGVYRCMSTHASSTALSVQDDSDPSTVDPWAPNSTTTLDIQLVVYMEKDEFINPANTVPNTVPLYWPKYLLTTRNVGAGVSISMKHVGLDDDVTTPARTLVAWSTARWLSMSGRSDADVRFNNSNAGTVTAAYAATVTPVPDLGETYLVGALTGNITIANPSHPYKGQRVGFRFLQDGTGSRSVTWGAAFKPLGWTIDPAASAKSTVTFLYDGTDWVRVSGDRPTASAVEFGIVVSDETTALTAGTAKVTFRMPFAMTVTAVRAGLTTASSSGVVTFDVNDGGSTILSTKLTVDASEKTSTTAATPAVISDSALADDAEVSVDIDTAGTGATGAKIWLTGTRN